MSIVKIQKVKQLSNLIDYAIQDYKIINQLVTSYECSLEMAKEDFQLVTDSYNNDRNKNKNIDSRMIIQSFNSDDNLTAEQVHNIGVEFANNYLKGNHQFIVITHEETDNFHNHIIFNSIDFNNLKIFDSKRQHTINDLRKENDLLSLKYNLTIPEKKYDKEISFKEYVTRSKGNSFKQKMEKAIDICISQSINYEDFLNRMNLEGYEAKEGKYLSFKNISSGKFLRTKTLGLNYLTESIKYRIEHKDFKPIKPDLINKEWIDKTQLKFKENAGLRKWATKKNIEYLSELSNRLYNNSNELKQGIIDENKIETFKELFEKDIINLDNELFSLEKSFICFQTYQNSFSLIQEYKKSENKQDYKKNHYQEFKEYDIAKKQIYILSKKYGIENQEQLEAKISDIKLDRNKLYGTLGTIKKEKEQERPKRKQERENDIER